ncbi:MULTISPECIES: LysR family transcriptional regulator [Pseudomonas]|jgi:DNA-binding transcriptional LysR family regulator|uniref:LysR family transcriptional regulator n=1 Tax=Pseudomonas kielensis TaxID=2762577 RepID=A0A7X1GED7_9PSED|nr:MULTISPECIES: LysR family transcriptional regulator [Pseudomonas]MBC2689908.1 LysR family transcriptional regulator [Pseudomonas kielensis]NBB32320.1 LysR family transcriptional regulator [Pseudomonas sp. BC115LW]UZM13916.1 LysR family transcriptional regulator [Pseudomonas kielensis]WKL54040.1 LysR family transcriptional regulator [Pseudomonas kielensis]
MVSLDRFDTFKAVVEAGSLTAAADLLGQTRAVVSFNLKRLEAELGVTLLTRSTRQLALTDAGERFYLRCLRTLDEARLAIEEARSEHTQLKGTLRITTTLEFALAQVVAALEVFRQQHPQLNIHLSTSSTHADLISERFDVAIRLGRMHDSNLRAVQLSTFEIYPVATRTLLERHGPVTRLAELEALPTLGHGRVPELTVTDPAGTEHVYQPQPGKTAIIADNSATLRAFALTGQGVAILPEWLIAEDLQQGRLQRLLPDHRFAQQGVYALYPDTRHLPLKVRAFIDFMKEWS